MWPALLLVAALAVLWRVIGGRGSGLRRRPRYADEDQARRATYRRSMARAAFAFLVPSVVALALMGRLPALFVLPVEFAPLAAAIGPLRLGDAMLFGAGLAGGSLGALVGTLWTIRRGKRGLRGPMFGDVGALLPRHRGDLPYAAALSVAAGITEEPFFRLLLPLLIADVTGSAAAGFGLAALLFGLAHRYQGWGGVAATGFMALLFTVLYLASGRLWVAMVFHAFLDVMGLVVRPALSGAWRAPPSVLEPPAGAEDPGDDGEADEQEERRHG